MKQQKKKLLRRLVTVFLVMILAFSLSIPVFAYSGVGFGLGEVIYGALHYKMDGWVYYNSNNASYLDLYSQATWVYNYCSFGINTKHFYAQSGDFTKQTTCLDFDIVPAVANGQSRRIEEDWGQLCRALGQTTKYTKSGSPKFVYTDLRAYYGAAGPAGGWECIWYQSSYSPSFHPQP